MFTVGFSFGEVPLLSQTDQTIRFIQHYRCKEGIKGVSIGKNMALHRNLV